ncbi:MAG: hypothetical protein ACRBCJ_12550 [Hyphomicrobiaceae bacterium]
MTNKLSSTVYMSRKNDPNCTADTQLQQGLSRNTKDDPWAGEVNDASGAGCGLAVKYEEARLKADDARSRTKKLR